MIDVIILTKLVEEKFFGLLNSLKKYTDMSRLNLFVCYTGDKDEDEHRINESLKDYSHKVITREYNFSKNCNELVKLGTSDKILFLNDDIELVSDSISYMSEILDKSENIGMVGLKLVYPNGKIQHYGQLLVLDNNDNFVGVGHFGINSDNCKTPDIYTQGVTSAMMMMRRKDYESIGGYNENYDRAFQDVELSWEIRKSGKKIICVGKEYAVHHESLTRGKNDMIKNDLNLMIDYWNKNKDMLLKDRNIYTNTIVKIDEVKLKTAVVAIMADYERPYLIEWVNYNKILGFDDIYIYENNCDFSDMKLPDFVHLIPYPGIGVQLKAYNDWIDKYRNKYDWVAFIDADEFIVLKKHADINKFLNDYLNVPALGLNWVLFGSKETEAYKGTKMIIDRFLWCQKGVNQHIKSLVNLKLHNKYKSILKCLSPHNTNSYTYSPDDLEHCFIAPFNPQGKRDTAYIAHYCTKTKEECMERRSKPRADCGITRENIEQFFNEHDKNEELNYDVSRIFNYNGIKFKEENDIEILK